MQTQITVIDIEETRKINAVKDPATGAFVRLEPEPRSEQAFLHLRLPSGHVVRAEIPYADFESHVVPLMDAR